MPTNQQPASELPTFIAGTAENNDAVHVSGLKWAGGLTFREQPHICKGCGRQADPYGVCPSSTYALAQFRGVPQRTYGGKQLYYNHTNKSRLHCIHRLNRLIFAHLERISCLCVAVGDRGIATIPLSCRFHTCLRYLSFSSGSMSHCFLMSNAHAKG